jgi:hypothetical protein
VSTQEIAAAVAPSQSFRDKVFSRFKTMAHRLHLGGTRSRSKSTGQQDHDAGGSLRATNRKQRSRDESPLPSPHPGPQTQTQAPPQHLQVEVPKRLLHFGIRSAEPSPHNQSTIQLGSPPLPPTTSMDDVPVPARKGSMPTTGRSGFLVRSRPNPIVLPNKPQLVPLADERSPTKMPSASSLDKYKQTRSFSPGPPLTAGPGGMQRRMSDIDVNPRQRAPSNASSSGMMGKLSSFIQRTASNRSRMGGRQSRASQASEDDHAITIASESPNARRMSVDDRSTTSRLSRDRERDHDAETFASSYSSHRLHSPGPGAEMAAQWTSRLPHPGMMHNSRRNSSPVTPFARHLGAGTSVEGLQGGDGEEEELDWIGSTSDSSDSDGGYDATPGPRTGFAGSLGLSSITPAAPNFTEQWRAVLGQSGTDGALPTPVATAPNLETVPDASPPQRKDMMQLAAPIGDLEAGHGRADAGKDAEQEKEMLKDMECLRIKDKVSTSPIAMRKEGPVSPSGSMRMRLSTSPTSTTALHGDYGPGYGYGHGHGHPRSASSGRSRAGSSPWRQQFDEYRARSPLGRLSDDEDAPPHSRSLSHSRRSMDVHTDTSSNSHSASVSISSSPARAPSFAAGHFSSGSAIGTHPTTPTHANMYPSGLISPLDLNVSGNPLNAPALSMGLGSGLTAMMRSASNTASTGHPASEGQESAQPSAPIQGLPQQQQPQPHIVHAPSPTRAHTHLAPGSSDGHGSRSHVEADDEGGLNISFGSRKGRGRKGSVLRSGAPSRTESPMPPPVPVKVDAGASAGRPAVDA